MYVSRRKYANVCMCLRVKVFFCSVVRENISICEIVELTVNDSSIFFLCYSSIFKSVIMYSYKEIKE